MILVRKNVQEVFDEMHDMARHCIHLSEVLEVTSQMLERLQKHQAAVRRRLRAGCIQPAGH